MCVVPEGPIVAYTQSVWKFGSPSPMLPSGPRIWGSGFWVLDYFCNIGLQSCSVCCFSLLTITKEKLRIKEPGASTKEPLRSCIPSSITQPSALPLNLCHLWNSALGLSQLCLACLSFPIQRFPPPFKSKPLSSCHHSQTPPSTCHPHSHTPEQEDINDEPGRLQPGPGCLCNESGGNWWPPTLCLKRILGPEVKGDISRYLKVSRCWDSHHHNPYTG